MPLNVMKELDFIKPAIVEAADKFVLPKYGKLVSSDTLRAGRYDKTQLTVDTNASVFLLERGRERFPGSFTEEHMSDERFNYDVVWVFDPLDGSDEYKHVYPGFVIQAALLERHGDIYRPAAGIIYDPLKREFVYATSDSGPFVEKHGTINSVTRPNVHKITGTQRAMDISPELAKFYQVMRTKGKNVSVVQTGGAGSTVMQMITGEKKPNLYIMPRPYTKEWDLSPAENMINRLGGWITDLDGNEFTYNRKNYKNEKGYVVAIGLDKDEILALIREFGVDNLLKNAA